jgi:uncharacterized protein Yka (UPF0111/DUF47 family)
MKSTKSFLLAPPERRTAMIIDGYEHVASKFQLLSHEIKILNSWMKLMPGLLADEGAELPRPEEFEPVIEAYEHAGDNLTKEIVDNALTLEQMVRAIQFYRQIIEKP